MLALGSLAFASPWLLVALAGLPIIWWLLRVTPPAARRIDFPAIRLLLGLVPRDETPARTPLWLILLRMALAALVIVAAAHPLLNPQALLAGTGPIILVIDDGWAAARDWPARQAALDDLLAEADAKAARSFSSPPPRPPATPQPPLAPVRAADARAAVDALQPKPWPVDRQAALARLKALSLPDSNASIWLSDGIADSGATAFAAYLDDLGSSALPRRGAGEAPALLAAGDREAKDLSVVLRSLPAAKPRLYAGARERRGRPLAGPPGRDFSRPAQNRSRSSWRCRASCGNQTTRVEVEDGQSAGAVLLLDERWRRRPVGIAGPPNGSATAAAQRELLPGTGAGAVHRGAPRAGSRSCSSARSRCWSIRESGPDRRRRRRRSTTGSRPAACCCASPGPISPSRPTTLLPVRLRRGGRTMGGAMSWEKPARLAPFAADSPFAGLAIPADVTVSRQVLAEPELDLAGKTWARLADGTPLVTAEKRGQGWIVLVHTTANAEWSNLALSGLFVKMLRRIVATSQGVTRRARTALPPVETLDGFGRLQRRPGDGATDRRQGYRRRNRLARITRRASTAAHDARRALNLSAGIGGLSAIAGLPGGTRRETYARGRETDFRPPLLAAALVLALIDLLIAFALRGLLRRRPARGAGT